MKTIIQLTLFLVALGGVGWGFYHFGGWQGLVTCAAIFSLVVTFPRFDRAEDRVEWFCSECETAWAAVGDTGVCPACGWEMSYITSVGKGYPATKEADIV